MSSTTDIKELGGRETDQETTTRFIPSSSVNIRETEFFMSVYFERYFSASKEMLIDRYKNGLDDNLSHTM